MPKDETVNEKIHSIIASRVYSNEYGYFIDDEGVEEIKAAITKWNPISSAPTDCREVLISGLTYPHNLRYVAVARYYKIGPQGAGWYGEEEQYAGVFLNVTHWADPPSTSGIES